MGETLDTKRLNYAHFHKTFFKRTTFNFNQSSVVGISIIINDDNMKQSRISLHSLNVSFSFVVTCMVLEEL